MIAKIMYCNARYLYKNDLFIKHDKIIFILL